MTHLDEVDYHVPLTTVTDKVPNEVTNEPVVERPVRLLQRGLEVVIGLVELVPEEQVRLSKRLVSATSRMRRKDDNAPGRAGIPSG